ncbi:MAG TPA: hypothetical protein VFX16_03780 [Pseudonocardiaceae bacterium]|nr:hypothetical protein [Pseudonocardiaceae bacterium]
MIGIDTIAAPGYLVPGDVRMSELSVGQTKLRTGRWVESNPQCGNAAKFAVANIVASAHVRVLTTPMTDAPTGVPPSALARRT